MHPRACLLLHGFTGGPYEVEPLAQYLRTRGWFCQAPTLAGHGGPLHQLQAVRREEWVQSAQNAADRLKEQYGEFDLVGFSMGGLIAAYLANRYPVRKLVLLNAAVIYVSPLRFVKHAMKLIREGNKEKLMIKQETPVYSVYQFMRLVKELKPEIANIRIPALVAQGDADEIVHPMSAKYIYRKLRGEKELAIFPNSQHLICLGDEAEMLFAKVERFLMN